MVSDILQDELNVLSLEGYVLKLIEAEGFANILFQKYPLPLSYNSTFTDLLLRLPLSYPNGKPDMFWTDERLQLISGKTPKSADVIETYLGRRWRRFSWHASTWNPGIDNLKVYLEFVNTGLEKAAMV
ncbi:MAG: hypothetical protein D9V45_14100 [Chloroflexi bacterium]|nr:MAG: hypothetical protein D9V45_14100 [Chloroflexota bacterium]